jgi:hypothetical protein
MKIRGYAHFCLIMTLASCSTQEFAGDSAVRQPVKPVKPAPPPNLDPPVIVPPITPQDPPDIGISTDGGGQIMQCDPKNMVEDPNATYSWASKLRAGDDIQGFVNSFNRYTHVNVGALFFDAATAKFACQLNGYLDQTGFTQGSFRSPDNNNIYRWDPGQKKLIQANAGTSGNKTIKTYSCRGKLKDPCKKDAGWIFQPPP